MSSVHICTLEDGCMYVYVYMCVHVYVCVCMCIYVYWVYMYRYACMCVYVCACVCCIYPNNHQEFFFLLLVPEHWGLSRVTIKHYNWRVVSVFVSSFSLRTWKVGSDQPNVRSVISGADFFLQAFARFKFSAPGPNASALHSLLPWFKKFYMYNYSHRIKMCVIIYTFFPHLTSLLSCSVWLFDDFPLSSLLTLCMLLSRESPARSSFP